MNSNHHNCHIADYISGNYSYKFSTMGSRFDNMISLRDGDSYKTSKFGDFCPYWTKDENGRVYISESFDEIITKIPSEKRYIDPVAVASLLQFNYIHGNRTLVKGINKIPWRASLLSNGTITREPPIPHNDIYASPFEIASTPVRLISKIHLTAPLFIRKDLLSSKK